jgi:hypothetical protein
VSESSSKCFVSGTHRHYWNTKCMNFLVQYLRYLKLFYQKSSYFSNEDCPQTVWRRVPNLRIDVQVKRRSEYNNNSNTNRRVKQSKTTTTLQSRIPTIDLSIFIWHQVGSISYICVGEQFNNKTLFS